MARHAGEVTGEPTGATLRERLASIAAGILRKILTAETVGLARAAIAEHAGSRIWRAASTGWGASVGRKPPPNF
jgi:hypothetical protein